MRARLVVGSVTTSESLVLYVFFGLFKTVLLSEKKWQLPVVRCITPTSGNLTLKGKCKY
ncbi:hypothetical protein B0T18DRAFT_79833 [Schizothecium vesticola]|uniref:Uncharacterized protein n=1 Tax=Schizothecium vesticola TaxID=314040 RepID=A0AA40F632_9PEZI|nr:hypothetical protein B0T18DRAFT_79833 [Schizothecium vesticola]